MNTSRLRRLTGLCVAGLLVGCAPARFEPAVSYYADQAKVKDASARRTKDFWYLRFNELIISDLDDAVRAGQAGQEELMRREAIGALRAAGSFADQATATEITRLPQADLNELARRANVQPRKDAVTDVYRGRSGKALQTLIEQIQTGPREPALALLKRIRSNIEPAPDDQGRAGRQIAFAWAAAPAWAGLENVEQTRERDRTKMLAKVFEQAAVYRPDASAENEKLRQFSPIIIIEWPEQREYPEPFDRFGEVYLTGSPKHIDVNINTSRPMMYFYATEAKINGERHAQLVYVWWYPERPPMSADDPAAGRIDGDTLRITFDRHGHPAILEVVQSCGCGHLVFVSDEIENLAKQEFGAPEPDKHYCVERKISGKRDLIVAGQWHLPAEAWRPLVYVLAGYHEVPKLDVASAAQIPDLKVHEQHTYSLAPYERLESLPLGNGIASMFGADGLVHNAGRREGVLLAPTGILSAGQPRKRGTQKIRWDDFSFDDPHLLENTLRLPKAM